MKPLIICAAILAVIFSCPTAEAKGCIKGAIVGGLAGHLTGHGKVGAVAGCVIGHHEAKSRTRPRPIGRLSLPRLKAIAFRPCRRSARGSRSFPD